MRTIVAVVSVILSAVLVYGQDKKKMRGWNMRLFLSLVALSVVCIIWDACADRSDRRSSEEKQSKLEEQISTLLDQQGPLLRAVRSRFAKLKDGQALDLAAAKFFDPRTELKRVEELLTEKGTLSRYDVLKIMILINQVLDLQEDQLVYPVLSFYCDWCLTPTGGSEEMATRMLLRLNEQGSLTSISMNDFIRNVHNAISLQSCRRELIELCESMQLPSGRFKQLDKWADFAHWLLPELCDKPIKFPGNIEEREDLLGRTYKRIREEFGPDHRFFMEELWITPVSWGESNQSWVGWAAKTEFGVTYKGKLWVVPIPDDKQTQPDPNN